MKCGAVLRRALHCGEGGAEPSQVLGRLQQHTSVGTTTHCSQVLLLDELTTFLDYEDQENVLQCVRRIVDSSRQQAAQGQQAQQPGAAGTAARQAPSSSGGGSREGAEQAATAGAAAAGAGVTALWVTHRLEELQYADSVR